ncbi:NFX1-type zinc finger-containing protein 1-like [Ciona intestinalis]
MYGGRGTRGRGTRGRGTHGFGTHSPGTRGFGIHGRGFSGQGTRGRGSNGSNTRGRGAIVLGLNRFARRTSVQCGSSSSQSSKTSSLDGQTPQGHRADNFQNFLKQLRLIQKNDIIPIKAVNVLLAEKAGFIECLNKETNNDVDEMMLYACGKIAQADGPSKFVLEILMEIIKSGFCEKIVALLNNLVTRTPDTKKAARQVSCCLKLMSLCLHLIPKDSTKEVSILTGGVKNVVGKIAIGHLEKINARLEEVIKRKDKVFRQLKDNFRNLSVFPTTEDIKVTSRPFLKENRIDAPYDSVDDYLDVQLRLLREDFVRPLREGIQNYHKLGKDPTSYQISKLDGIRVYQNVRVQFQEPSERGMQYQIHFDPRMVHRVDWENSKRFMSGNLLCFSSDNFNEPFLVGLVANTNPSQLRHGNLMVDFVTPNQTAEAAAGPNGNSTTDKVHMVDMSLDYTLIETNAFFGSYHHVLTGLKGCHSAKNVLNDTQWPTAEKLHMDESQKFALQTAITKEIALIQGPPGTGKTFVGLKMMKLLLKNFKSKFGGKYPILVVCGTNHALDQFLEGIAKFHPKGIVRVGGGCKTESLQKYVLTALKANCRGSAFRGVIGDIKTVKKDMQKVSQMLDASSECVISLSKLKPVIPQRIFQQFVCFYNLGKFKSSYDNALLDWLGFSNVETTISYIVKEIVNNFLQRIDVPENVKHLLEVYHEIEVKCAVYVLTKRQQNKLSTEETGFPSQVEMWLQQRTEAKVTTLKDGKNVNEATDLIQDNKKMDTDPEQEVTKSKRQAKSKIPIKHLNQTKVMSNSEMDSICDIIDLNESKRWELYRLWVELWKSQIKNLIAQHLKNYKNHTSKLEKMREEESYNIFRRADVIGMTTTGAAKYRSIINRLPVKVVIVEEAAEVLEAHIVTSMPQSTEHLILIGDHQQLKPSPTVYELATKMNLDVSLFERLVKNELPFAQLTCQHRMKPRIADLIRPHIYKTLTDHEVVKKHEEIPGVEKSLYFISHDKIEGKVIDGKSKKNQHEAEFMVALCKYFLMHEFKPEQITILATYTGQVLALKNIIRSSANELKEVRVTAVDSFQGEENDIILLSLVRSNEQKNIGFLKIHNRVCVALSRAKRGLFCIGNLQLLRSKNNIWESIVSDLERDQLIGPALKLQCKNHPETCLLVESAEDFKKFPEGGCGVPCDYPLNCGHVCTRTCHPDDSDHSKFQCMEPCIKSCLHGHGQTCLKTCWQDCVICPVLVDKVCF